MGYFFFSFHLFSGRESERKLAVQLAPSSEIPSDSSWTSLRPDTLTPGHLDELAPDKKVQPPHSPRDFFWQIAPSSCDRIAIELAFSKWIFHSSQCNDAVLVISPIISHFFWKCPCFNYGNSDIYNMYFHVIMLSFNSIANYFLFVWILCQGDPCL